MSVVCLYVGFISVASAYDNIALHKPAYQEHPYKPHGPIVDNLIQARNAVDGLKSNRGVYGGQCVISANNQTIATWWVNLTSILSIHHITIYYRTGNVPWGSSNGFAPRFIGFSLYVSNTTDKSDGVLCFKDNDYTLDTIPYVFNTTCAVHGQYVIYFNEYKTGDRYANFTNDNRYAFNELCELEVYGCPIPGFYGLSCNKTCTDPNCRYCNIETGTCQGCKPGYQGHRCELECPNGFFGERCANSCNSKCRGCNNINGSCDRGCRPGWKGDFCQEPCDDKTFGGNCSEKCGNCFQMDTCNHFNGSCMNGCDRGYKGLICKEPCAYGYFGYDCKHTCNSTCNGCDAVDGLCNTGCMPGWTGDNCLRACDNGTFGQNCSEKCGSCAYFGQCHHVNGICLEGCVSGFIGSTCKARFVKTEESTYNTGPIVGAVVGVLVGSLVVLAIVIIIRMKRGKSSNEEKYKTVQEETITENQYSSVDRSTTPSGSRTERENKSCAMLRDTTVEENDFTNSCNSINVYMNETFSNGIPLEKLDSTVAGQGSKEYNSFKKEFAALPSGEIHTCEVGRKPDNIPKNRFKTTFPYDHSRVVLSLTDGESSDYINANYIDGTNRPKEYIAAQGPKQNTVDDFWKMIWQEDINSIVMLTNLKEGDKVKCFKYWPSRNESLCFGNISVELIEEKMYAFFIEKKLSVTNLTIKKTRSVTQYHYISWPDHRTPEPIGLLDFHHHVTTTANRSKVPTLVHCSAGVGRTGTYIALDALYREGRNTGEVNVVEFVKKMRNNRMSMVQTYEQYITIYLALNEVFKAPIRMYSSTEFCSKMEKTMKDTPANRNLLRKEFKLLQNVRPTYSEKDYKIATQSSPGKHTDVVLPLDKYSLHLFPIPMIPKRGSYINAICLPSLTDARRFIVTHYPTPEDAVDFLRLLNDHESDTVICMDPVHSVESIKGWLPDLSCSKVVSPFTIHRQPHSRNGTGQMIDIVQNNQPEDEVHSVLVEGPRINFNPGRTSHDTSELLHLVTTVLFLKTENPITVVSSDGASLCGVFIAVHNAIQQLKMDSAVDVFTIVRQLQIRRPELCDSIEEYEMIQRAVYDHIQSATENIYSN
uniref:protein-tyrosine-phosphatase n=1 Tax=Crassostrea virginica TaxID=6565 RepID=A0A8B8BYR5_CRAVI|nr:receptor-type tyrosine-protein phosphatase T-like isoform X2 [Crassostrea virginica]